MENKCMPPWGTMIERGIVTKKESVGGTVRYDVASYDRPGITGSGIAAAFDNEYQINDRVYFFLFTDGTGQILSAAGV